ncbi:dystonin isoform X8 [Hydra vulgaris]|uniref:Dystonin isoform X8 n=1 Tax=Hydra vulgaris TaxID=6087 RepID=A0ABM4D1V0_HYDVU
MDKIKSLQWRDKEDGLEMDLRQQDLKEERAVVQKKVFTKWCNTHLVKINVEIKDLYEDFRDGRNLILLVELLTNESLRMQKGTMRFYCLQNVTTALGYLNYIGIKLVNIRSEDIVDGNTKLTLGLVWILILNFQLSDIKTMTLETESPKQKLLFWSQTNCEGYEDVDIKNFSSSWSDGLAFGALLHRHRPDLIDYAEIKNASPPQRMEIIFQIAEKELGIPKLLDVEDVIKCPDDKTIITYVSAIHKVLPSMPPRLLDQIDADLKTTIEVYCNRVSMFIEWLSRCTISLNSRDFPKHLQGMQDLLGQAGFFSTQIYPEKNAERRHLATLFTNIKTMKNPKKRSIDVPYNYTVECMNQAWEAMVQANQQRCDDINKEIERLEQLQQVAKKVEKECSSLENSLGIIETELDNYDKGPIDSNVQENMRKLDQNVKAIKVFRLPIKTLSSSTEILVKSVYQNSEELQKRAGAISVRWEKLNNRVQTELQTLKSEHNPKDNNSNDKLSLKELSIPSIISIIEEDVCNEAIPLLEEEVPISTDEESACLSNNEQVFTTEVNLTSNKENTVVQPAKSTKEASLTSDKQPVVKLTISAGSKRNESEKNDSSKMTGIRISKRSGVQPITKVYKKQKKLKPFSIPNPWSCTRKQNHSSSDEEMSENSEFIEGCPETELNATLQNIRVAYNWVKFILDLIKSAEYGMDLPSNEAYLEENEIKLKEILKFREEIDKICSVETLNHPTEINMKLEELRLIYNEALECTMKRSLNLKSLTAFMQACTEQLIWLSQQEDIEVSRNWSDKNLSLEMLAENNEKLRSELIVRDQMIQEIVKNGHLLTADLHPATSAIEAYVGVVQTQLKWAYQLQIAFQTHYKNASFYFKFFEKAYSYEKWLVESVNKLKNLFDGVDLESVEALYHLIEKLLEIRRELFDHKGEVSLLGKWSKEVVPLKKRHQKYKTPEAVITVCNYEQEKDVICCGESVDLIDNSNPFRWKVSPPSGVESEVPSVCFVIPAPDAEATELSTRIEIQYKHLITLWKNRQWRVKQALSSSEVFTRLKVLKLPTFNQILNQPYNTEEMLEEFEKQLDPSLEMEENEVLLSDDINDITENFNEDFIEDLEMSKTVSDLLLYIQMVDESLNTKNEENMNADLLLKELEESIKTVETIETSLQPKFDFIVLQESFFLNSKLKDNFELLIKKWNVVKTRQVQWVKRVMYINEVLLFAADVDQWLKKIEMVLIEQHGFSSDTKFLKLELEQIKDLEKIFELQKENFDKLQSMLIYEGHPINSIICLTLTERWISAGKQINMRQIKLEEIFPLLIMVCETLHVELSWFENICNKLMKESLPFNDNYLQAVLVEYKIIYNGLLSHLQPLQNLFYKVEELILASKSYEYELIKYKWFVEGNNNLIRPGVAAQGRNGLSSKILQLAQFYEMSIVGIPQRMSCFLSMLEMSTISTSGVSNIVEIGEWQTVDIQLIKLEDWITKKENDLKKYDLPLGSIKELEQYMREIENVLTDVRDHEISAEETLNAGRQFLQENFSLMPSTTRVKVEKKVAALELQWAKLQWECEGRNTRLIMIHDMLGSYEKAVQPFLIWLKKAEQQAQSFHINAPDLESVQDLFRQHQIFVNEVRRHEADLQRVNHHGDAFLSEAKAFQSELENYLSSIPDSLSTTVNTTSQTWVLERKLHQINDQYKKLIRVLSFKGNLLSESIAKHQEYAQKLQVFLPWLAEAERQLAREMQETIPSDPKKLYKKIEVIKQFNGDVQAHHHNLVSIQMSSDVLTNLEKRDDEHVKGDTAIYAPGMWLRTTTSVIKRYENLSINTVNFESQLQSLYITVQNFVEGIEIMFKWGESSYVSLKKMSPISSDIFTLIQQVREIKVTLIELEGRQPSLLTLLQTFEKGKTDKSIIKHMDRINSIRKTFEELQKDAFNRKEECVASYLKYVSEFEIWLERVLKRLISCELLTTDILVFEENLLKLSEDVEFHRQAFQFINQCGHELISINKSKHTSTILPVLDKVNKMWQAVAIQLINHTRKFDEVVKCSEKYHSTLQPLLQWFEKMEGRITTIAPVAIDPQVILEQLTEQKALLNDACNHKGTIEILTHIGESLVFIIYIQDRVVKEDRQLTPIELEVKSCRDRYDDIITVLEARGLNLESTLTQSEQYHVAYNDIMAWLDCAEDIQMKWKPLGSTLEIVRLQYVEHQIFHRDLINGSPEIRQMLEYGKDLIKDRETVRGAPAVRSQLDIVVNRWEMMLSTSNKRQVDLENALGQRFKERVYQINVWIKKKELDVQSFFQKKQSPADINKYIGELLIEIQRYEYIFLTVHRSSKQLTDAGQTDKIQVYELLAELDDLWSNLSSVYQTSEYFSGKVRLRSPKELESDMKMEDEIASFLEGNRKRKKINEDEIPQKFASLDTDFPDSEKENENEEYVLQRPYKPVHFDLKLPNQQRIVQPTVVRRTYMDENTSDLMSSQSDQPQQEFITIDENGRKVRKIITKKVTRTQRRIIRRKYIDENGEEHVEEVELPEGQEPDYIINHGKSLDEGAIIIHSPDETDTATEEELVRDSEGNIIKRIVKKVTQVTKRTRIIRRTIIDEDGNKKVVEEEVPIDSNQVIESNQYQSLPVKSSSSQSVLELLKTPKVDRVISIKVERDFNGDEYMLNYKESVLSHAPLNIIGILKEYDERNGTSRIFVKTSCIQKKELVQHLIKVYPNGIEQEVDNKIEVYPEHKIQIEATQEKIPLYSCIIDKKPESLTSKEMSQTGTISKILRSKEIIKEYLQYETKVVTNKNEIIYENILIQVSENNKKSNKNLMLKHISSSINDGIVEKNIICLIPIKTMNIVYEKEIYTKEGKELHNEQQIIKRENKSIFDDKLNILLKGQYEEKMEVISTSPNLYETKESKQNVTTKNITIHPREVKRVIVLSDGTRKEENELNQYEIIDNEKSYLIPTQNIYSEVQSNKSLIEFKDNKRKTDEKNKTQSKRARRPSEETPEDVDDPMNVVEEFSEPDSSPYIDDSAEPTVQRCGRRKPEEEQVFTRPHSQGEKSPESKKHPKDSPHKGAETDQPVLSPVVKKTVALKKKTVRKIIVLPDGTRKEVEEEVPAEDVSEMPSDDAHVPSVLSPVVKKTVVLKKKIIRRIVVLPDGTRKEVEEEVPAEEESEMPYSDVPYARSEGEHSSVFGSQTQKMPTPVERVYVTRVLRKPDGSEHLIDESETVFPMEITSEDLQSEVVESEGKDERGVFRVVKKPLQLTRKKTTTCLSEVLPNGDEREIERSAEESPESEQEPTKSRKVVRCEKKLANGETVVVEEAHYISPLTSSLSVPAKPEISERTLRGKPARVVCRKTVTTYHVKVFRSTVLRSNGKADTSPVEDCIEEPIEAARFTIVRRTVIRSDGSSETREEPRYELPQDAKPTVEAVTDKNGKVTRRVRKVPKPVVTYRKVYRKIILAPDGTEAGVEEKVEESKRARRPSEETPEDVDDPMNVVEEFSEPDSSPYIDDSAEPTVQRCGRRKPEEEQFSRDRIRKVKKLRNRKKHPKDSPHKGAETDQPVLSPVVKKTVALKKKTVRRVIVLPDGTRKEVEEEVPAEDDSEMPSDDAHVPSVLSPVVKKTVVLKKKIIRRHCCAS